MQMNLREREGVAIAELDGRLPAGVGDEQLRKLIDDLLAEGRTKILLDMSGVAAIDSSGVGELVAGLKVCEEFGTKLKILQASEKVHHTLQLTAMLPLFEFHGTEEATLRAFGN